MNTMNINYTRPTRVRKIITTTDVTSMLDAFWVLQAIADSLSAAERSAERSAGFVTCTRP